MKCAQIERLKERKIERSGERARKAGGGGCVCVVVAAIIFDMKWAVPGGTAIPGQPVARAEQAPDISPLTKNQFNIVVPM